MGRTVIFGGTFNPIHNGHIEIINSLLRNNTVKSVIVMPTHIPPHKSCSDLASDIDRLNMCRLALADMSNVTVSDAEIKRDGKSYTYDTVCELQKEYSQLGIACGGDMIASFDKWYKYSELIKLVHIYAYRRDGVSDGQFDMLVRKIESDGGSVTVINSKITDISSTLVRAGDYSKIPSCVADYIKAKGLYSND